MDMKIRDIRFRSDPAPLIPELEDPEFTQNVTWCEDTPENWARFYRLKELIVSGELFQPHAPSLEPRKKKSRKPALFCGYNTSKS